ncbi:TonB-dependent receptor [Putridiphycobacter roseus]|uniref:TonB-dependent receptor n=1 Tax=Putridiphycobacter roseus TaxID=2219161 RepID=A0A2W1N5L7_9FLAO|nr:TonB-dependent receptor [Putridiphycobacter roseus]PZE18900.1 TonB-dependent receptor [Putridiphycobacter roseus]
MRFTLFLLTIICLQNSLFSQQNGVIKGKIVNSISNAPIPFAKLLLVDTEIGGVSNLDGEFEINNIPPGFYNLSVSYIGFRSRLIQEINVTPVKPIVLEISLEEVSDSLTEVEVRSSPFQVNKESPISLINISAEEIMRNPGGNRDISKVLQSFPGVGATSAFRNDILVRGGAPSENRFYLDGIEVPNINHFATQGSSGGPVGLINVNFIRQVEFYSSAFPTNNGNALSSVISFDQKEGNYEKFNGTLTVGSSDLGLTLEGPLGKSKKSSFLFSARRSYLEFLFKALALPFLPAYNDFQYKQTYRINEKNKLTFIGLGAIDQFSLNEGVNDNETDAETIERNKYILGYLPVSTQWNYTVGAKWTRYTGKGFQNFVISRNMLNNKSEKYQNNIETPANKILDYTSQEMENKFRYEHTFNKGKFKVKYGAGVETAKYNNNSFNRVVINGAVKEINLNSALNFVKYGVFAQTSRNIFNNRLSLSLGIRTDANSYSSDMSNPLNQISPRFSASYALTDKWKINASIGRYFQLPAYTVLGYRNEANELVNKANGVQYIRADHFVAGLEYRPSEFSKITLEGFYKKYANYPFLLNDSISLANLGGDFGVIGNEPVNSSSKGRTYGVEVFAQQKLRKKFFGIISYTFVVSEFTDANNNYISSAWDVRHIASVSVGRKFKNNWQVGMKFRFSGGAPYTPYNTAVSSLIPVWDVTQRGILNYDQLNTLRLKPNHALDIRIDKKWYFSKTALNFYIDIQNVYNSKTELSPYFTVVKDDNENPIVNPNLPNSYEWKYLSNISGTLLPSIGLMFEF